MRDENCVAEENVHQNCVGGGVPGAGTLLCIFVQVVERYSFDRDLLE
jgi:hypothetical protein